MLGVFINNTINETKREVNYNNYKQLKKNFFHCIIIDNINDSANLLKSDITKENANDNVSYFQIYNDNYLEKISISIEKADKFSYSNLVFIEDNYIYCNSLQNYFNYINSHKILNICSYTDSSEIEYHLQIFMLSVNFNIINKFKKFLNEKNFVYNDVMYNLLKIFNNSYSYLKIAYNESNINKNIFLNNDYLYKILMDNNELPIISIQKIKEYQTNIDDRIILKDLPENFDVEIYREYNDLYNYSDEFLKKHFINFGQYEKRRYSDECYFSILPLFIRKYLNSCNLLELFDFPEKFDLLVYREYNKDLNNFNIYDLFNHWVQFGRYENRIYNL